MNTKINKKLDKWLYIALFTIHCSLFVSPARAHEVYNFNSNWEIDRSELGVAEKETVTLPHAWNEDEAFKVHISELSTGVVWYRKTFTLPAEAEGQRVVIEFEGARQAADVYVNGYTVGYNENGVMAFGFDITDYVNFSGENLIEVKTDNSWTYKARVENVYFQWNSSRFYANYGGLPKDVRLHLLPKVHQTLPIYSNLGTTGIYVYAKDFDVPTGRATICVESEVQNDMDAAQTEALQVEVTDMDGQVVASFTGAAATLEPNGARTILKAEKTVSGLHFWSWGYGYLYKVKTTVAGDERETITGFRKTEFKDGMFYLNDRVMMVHGYAQRSTNEWPGVGCAVPAWVSDLSNDVCVKSGGNLVRWMHVTPSIQDIQSCDRVGLLQALPAGDAEHDLSDARWDQRVALMRDAIIYNRNSPSVIFYECGNNEISDAHQQEMLDVRDLYDPNGGRAMGCRNMLDSKVAEYGGTMLNINKSSTKPVWMMEYCRDEGVRYYWNSWSYPYHQQGYDQVYYNYEVNGTDQLFEQVASPQATVAALSAYLHIPHNPKQTGALKMVFTDDYDPTNVDGDTYDFTNKAQWGSQNVCQGKLLTYDIEGEETDDEGVSFCFAEGKAEWSAGSGLKFTGQYADQTNYISISIPAGKAADITVKSAGSNRRINASFTLGSDGSDAIRFNDGNTSTRTLTNDTEAPRTLYVYQPLNYPNSILQSIRIYTPEVEEPKGDLEPETLSGYQVWNFAEEPTLWSDRIEKGTAYDGLAVNGTVSFDRTNGRYQIEAGSDGSLSFKVLEAGTLVIQGKTNQKSGSVQLTLGDAAAKNILTGYYTQVYTEKLAATAAAPLTVKLTAPIGATAQIFAISWVPDGSTQAARSLTATLDSRGYATFCPAVSVSLSEGVKAYTLKSVNTAEGTITPTEVTTTIPALAAVILVGEGNTDVVLTGKTGTERAYGVSSASSYGSNYINTLHGAYKSGITLLGATGTQNYYAYKRGSAQFARVDADLYIPEGLAYFTVAKSLNARELISIGLSDGETTGISEASPLMNSERVNSEVYDLQGRRVSNAKKGLYICNGRKIVVK